MLTRVLSYLRELARRRRVGAEIDDELGFHIEQEIRANLARGMSAAEARRQALRDLGGLTQTTDAVRGVRATWLDTLWRDVRHAVRSLRGHPSFSVVALLVLMLSSGASTAVFSVVDTVVLRGLPFPDDDRLVAVGEVNIKSAPTDYLTDWMTSLHLVAPQNYLDWRADQKVFTGLAALASYGEFPLRRDGQQLPEVLRSSRATAEFFRVLQVPPMLGRTFREDEEVDGPARVAVISHALWRRRFGGDPDILGRRLPGQRVEPEIVGVMPPAFVFPVGAANPTDVWVPYVVPANERVRGSSYGYYLQVIGRLREGVSVDQAQTEMDRITARLAAETPAWFEDRAAKVEPLHTFLTRRVRPWMLMLLGAVAFVLLLACANLSNLTLVRATARSRELGIRAALGASTWDLARVLLIESLVLSLTGAALGMFVAWLAVGALQAAMPADVPRVAAIAVDFRVFAVTAAAAIATGLAFGLAPVIQFARPAASSSLHDTGRAHTAGPGPERLRAALVIAEIALAVVLLVGAALFLASFARVSRIDLGLNYRDVLTVRVRPVVSAQNFADARAQHPARLERVLDRLRRIPGVELASILTQGLPFSGALSTRDFAIPGRDLPKGEDIDLNEVSPDYFRVLQVPLLRGRFFTADDRRGAEPVAILNDATVRHYFGADDPIGRRIQFEGLRTVVGVVGNIRHDGPETDWRRQGFVPLAQGGAFGGTLVLRTSRPVGQVLSAVREAIWSEFPDLVGLDDTQTLESLVRTLVAQRQLHMLLLGLFGLLGLLIAAIGIYGVMAYVVSQRTQEIGIRLALGALPSDILRSVLRRAAAYLVLGMAIGLTVAWLLSGVVRGWLFEVQPRDPLLYGAVCAVLTAVTLAAAFVPASRASAVDPVVALRAEG